MDFIKCENLNYVYKEKYKEGKAIIALNNINLTVKENEFIVILGGNGSGKSSLAKHFNALLTPSAGKCFIKGKDTSDLEEIWNIRQLVGMVFQNPDNQIVATIVEEDVAFGPENIGMESTEIRKKVNEVLKIVGMSDYKLHKIHHLSGGQKQRIAIAGALALDAQCLVLDEPTAMLDPKGRNEVLDTLIKLNTKKNKTIIHITHYMEEALIADRIIVMSKGKILIDDLPINIFSNTELVEYAKLDVPLAIDLANKIRLLGISMPKGIINKEQLLEFLCP